MEKIYEDGYFVTIFLSGAHYAAEELTGDSIKTRSDTEYEFYLQKEKEFESSLSPIEVLDWQREKAVNPDIIERERATLVCRYALHPDDESVREMLEDDLNMGSMAITTEDLPLPINPENLSSTYLEKKTIFIRREVRSRPCFFPGAKLLDWVEETISEIEKAPDSPERTTFFKELEESPDMDFLHRLNAGIHYLEDPTNPDTKMVLKEVIEKYTPEVKKNLSKRK